MAQLVKLLDYVSRYEQDLPHYTTQFIRLKNYQWRRLQIQWEQEGSLEQHPFFEEEVVVEEEPKPLLQRLVGRWTKKEEVEQEETIDEEIKDDFTPRVGYGVKTKEQLKAQYYEDLYAFQLKWASSTLLSHSTIHPKFERDSLLKELVQKLPDNYLILYEPILRIKKAPIEMNILIMTPVGCYSITSIEHEDVAAYVGSSERFWTKKVGERDFKILNPTIDLNRNVSIITKLFQERSLDYPVKKILLSRNGYIDYPSAPFGLHIVDRRNYKEWLNTLTHSVAPFKSLQFRAADRLLRIAQTTASSQLFAPTLQDDEKEEQ